ncbi:MAG: heme-copper oxidase subunit III [Candidatus Acidiferrum sp.]|jgi:cytochrome c oxidase subunit 3
MPGTTIDHEIELIIEDVGGGGGGNKPPASGGGGDDNGGKKRRPAQPSPRRYYTGITLAILSILMFFMALASAFIVRRGSNDWIPVHIPAILWLNTVVLLASSATLEFSRRRLAVNDIRGFRALWAGTTALGAMFVVGQVIAWRQLFSQGIFVASNPGSSFFYVFTGLHGVHLFGGLCALLYVLVRNFERAKVTRPVAAEIVGHYWHFMDALWVFLLALLYLGK